MSAEIISTFTGREPQQPEASGAGIAWPEDTEQAVFALAEGGEPARLFLGARNERHDTWLSIDGVSVSMRNDLLVGTRGFGGDLMGADVSETHAALLNGGGTAVREVAFLDSLDQIVRRSFVCDVEGLGATDLNLYGEIRPTVRFVERCTGPDYGFENQYWVGRDGRIWQSRQWVSPMLGYIDHQLL